MSNPYYTATGNPGTGSTGLSALMRAEFTAISAAFDLLPSYSGNAGLAVVVNAGGSGLTLTTGQLALAGNFTTTGLFNTVFAQSASITITLPSVAGTLATLAGTESLSNKTLVAPALGTPISGVMTNVTGTAAGLTAGNATTAVNQSGGTVSATMLAASGAVSGQGFIDRLASPGPIGNTAASTGAFTTLAASSTVSGTGFTAWAASPPPIGGTAAAAGAFTSLSASGTVSGTGFSTYLASPPAIGGSAPAAGAFTALSASGTVSGAGFSTYLASPPAIGGVAPAAGSFTTLSASSTATAPTAAPGTNTTQIGSTAFVTAAVLVETNRATTAEALLAPKANPTLSGTVVAPTINAGAATALVLQSNSTTALTISTTQNASLVGNLAMASSFMRNRLNNGAMQVDQWNAGASGTAITVYAVDRWFYGATQSTKGTWGQNLNSVTTAAGFPNYLGFQSSSAYSVLAGDSFQFQQNIEGYNFADLGFGTASAQTVTLSFSVYSSLTGTFGGALKNYAGTRSYPFTYSINAANTWTSISVTIPGDTSGTWVGSTNGGAAKVIFGLGAGSTYSGTAGAWGSVSYNSATGAVSVVGTLNATFYVTGVQLEPGSVATPFERRPINEVLAQCQRYFYSATNGYGGTYAASAGLWRNGRVIFPTQMRTAPTLAATGIVYTNASGLTFEYITVNGAGQILTAATGGAILVNFNYTASAEL